MPLKPNVTKNGVDINQIDVSKLSLVEQKDLIDNLTDAISKAFDKETDKLSRQFADMTDDTIGASSGSNTSTKSNLSQRSPRTPQKKNVTVDPNKEFERRLQLQQKAIKNTEKAILLQRNMERVQRRKEVQEKSFSKHGVRYAGEIDDIVDEMHSYSPKNLSEAKKRLSLIKHSISDNTFGQEQKLLTQHLEQVEKTLAQETSRRNTVVGKIGSFFNKSNINAISVVGALSSNNPLLGFVAKHAMDTFRKHREKKQVASKQSMMLNDRLQKELPRQNVQEAADKDVQISSDVLRPHLISLDQQTRHATLENLHKNGHVSTAQHAALRAELLPANYNAAVPPPPSTAQQAAPQSHSTQTAPPKSQATTRRNLEVGDLVQWESQGVLQFKDPKKIREITADGQWAFVEGSSTGIPTKELKKVSGSGTSSPKSNTAKQQAATEKISWYDQYKKDTPKGEQHENEKNAFLHDMANQLESKVVDIRKEHKDKPRLDEMDKTSDHYKFFSDPDVVGEEAYNSEPSSIKAYESLVKTIRKVVSHPPRFHSPMQEPKTEREHEPTADAGKPPEVAEVTTPHSTPERVTGPEAPAHTITERVVPTTTDDRKTEKTQAAETAELQTVIMNTSKLEKLAEEQLVVLKSIQTTLSNRADADRLSAEASQRDTKETGPLAPNELLQNPKAKSGGGIFGNIIKFLGEGLLESFGFKAGKGVMGRVGNFFRGGKKLAPGAETAEAEKGGGMFSRLFRRLRGAGNAEKGIAKTASGVEEVVGGAGKVAKAGEVAEVAAGAGKAGIFSKMLGGLGEVGGVGKILGKLGGATKLLGKAAVPLAIIMGIIDFIEGFINAERFFGDKKKLTTMDRVAGGLGNVVKGIVGIVDFFTGLIGLKTDIGGWTGRVSAKLLRIVFKTIGGMFTAIGDVAKFIMKMPGMDTFVKSIEVLGKWIEAIVDLVSNLMDIGDMKDAEEAQKATAKSLTEFWTQISDSIMDVMVAIQKKIYSLLDFFNIKHGPAVTKKNLQGEGLTPDKSDDSVMGKIGKWATDKFKKNKEGGDQEQPSNSPARQEGGKQSAPTSPPAHQDPPAAPKTEKASSGSQQHGGTSTPWQGPQQKTPPKSNEPSKVGRGPDSGPIKEAGKNILDGFVSSGDPALDEMMKAIAQMEGNGYKKNNPGNLRTVGGGPIRTFPTMADGWKALAWQLQNGKAAGLKNPKNLSFYDLFNLYAPGTDHNDPKHYAEVVASKLKMDPSGSVKDQLAARNKSSGATPTTMASTSPVGDSKASVAKAVTPPTIAGKNVVAAKSYQMSSVMQPSLTVNSPSAAPPTLDPASATNGVALARASNENRTMTQAASGSGRGGPTVIAPSSSVVNNSTTQVTDLKARNNETTYQRMMNSQYVPV